jgi:hypothetical protein
LPAGQIATAVTHKTVDLLLFVDGEKVGHKGAPRFDPLPDFAR